MKFKKNIILLVLMNVFLFAFIVGNETLFANNQVSKNGVWKEETNTQKGTIDFGVYQVEFGFGKTEELLDGTLNASDIQLSKPNVFIKGQNGQIINHIFSQGGHSTSGNFQLAFPYVDDTGKATYEIYDTPGKGGKLYTLRDENNDIIKIKGVVVKEIPRYGNVEITTVMTKE